MDNQHDPPVERSFAYEDGREIWPSTAIERQASSIAEADTNRFVLGELPDSRFWEWLVWTIASATPVFSVAAWITIAFRRRQPRLAYDAAIAALWPLASFLILFVLAAVVSFTVTLFFFNMDPDYLAYRQETEQLMEYHDAYHWIGTSDQLGKTEAVEAALSVVRSIDLYIEQTQPFRLAKDPEKLPQVGTILYNCAEALRVASLLLWPVLPDRMQQLWERIGCAQYAETLADRGRGDLTAWAKWGQLEPGTPVSKGEPLFPRYDES